MIHAVTLQNLHYYPAQLDEMFRMRHQYYVQDNGWQSLHSNNGRETDEFDNDEAVYLMGLDNEGHVASTVRLNPTMGDNFTARHHEAYIEGKPPRSHEIWDLTRFMVDPRYRGAVKSKSLKTGQEVGCGVLEFAMSKGVSHITSICETHLFERLNKIGWTFRTMGPVVKSDDDKSVAQAIILDVNQEMLRRMRSFDRVTQSVLRIMPADPPEFLGLQHSQPFMAFIEGLIEIAGQSKSEQVMEECISMLRSSTSDSLNSTLNGMLALPHTLTSLLENSIFSTTDGASAYSA